MAITGDYNMAIITLDSLYSELSCRSTYLDALSVLYGQHVDTGGTYTLPGSYLHQEWASRRFGHRLLVGFHCVNIYHMGSLDLSPSRSRTCPCNLVRGVTSASLLEELIPDQDMGVAPDLASRPELGQGSLFGLVPTLPQPSIMPD
jgi:hypothetical protein